MLISSKRSLSFKFLLPLLGLPVSYICISCDVVPNFSGIWKEVVLACFKLFVHCSHVGCSPLIMTGNVNTNSAPSVSNIVDIAPKMAQIWLP
jgi:hypothetical protein